VTSPYRQAQDEVARSVRVDENDPGVLEELGLLLSAAHRAAPTLRELAFMLLVATPHFRAIEVAELQRQTESARPTIRVTGVLRSGMPGLPEASRVQAAGLALQEAVVRWAPAWITAVVQTVTEEEEKYMNETKEPVGDFAPGLNPEAEWIVRESAGAFSTSFDEYVLEMLQHWSGFAAYHAVVKQAGQSSRELVTLAAADLVETTLQIATAVCGRVGHDAERAGNNLIRCVRCGKTKRLEQDVAPEAKN
jgi:hypothetical protein